MHHLNAVRIGLAVIATASIVTADLVINGSVCDTSEFSNTALRGIYFFDTQADLDAKLGACTIILGAVWIGQNYSGSFVLNNATNITSGISTWGSYNSDNQNLEANETSPLLTSIQADSLVWTWGVQLNGVPALKSLSMASLESAEELSINSNPTLSLNFPQLKDITDIQILGGFSSLKIDQLVNVERSMYIGTTNSSEDGQILLFREFPEPSTPPIDIKFSSLVNATYMMLWGNISSLSMPNLATSVVPADPIPELEYFDSGISIQNWGNPLNISLPSLWNTTALSVAGNLGTLSYSSLKDLAKYIVWAFNPLAINLDPMQTVWGLYLWGNVTSANMSTLQDIHTLNIQTDGVFNCKQAGEEFAKIDHIQYSSNWENMDSLGFSCFDTPKPKSHLSKGAKIGIGVGIGVPGLALLLWLVNRKSKKDEAKRKELEATKPPPGYHLANLDRVPEYTPPETESLPEGAVNGSAGHEVAVEGHMPPDYESHGTTEVVPEHEGEARTDHHTES